MKLPGTAESVLPARVVFEPTDSTKGDDGSKRQVILAAWVFAIFIAVGAVALVGWLGHYFWFHGDEWNYLVNRNGGNIADLFHPRNEHLSLLPIATYRVLWNLFGLRSYVPYQIPVIAVHLTTAILLRIIMRRCGVNPWIATAAASLFVLFGPGEESIIWGAQIGQGGTIAFGLGQLVVADHEGPLDWRDFLALALGFLAFLSSGFAPFTIAIVGVVVLVRRGIRPALLQTVPIAVAYVTWFLVVGFDQIKDPYGRAADWSAIVRFVKEGLVATFEGVAQGSALLAVLYGLALILGISVAWFRVRRGERLRRLIVPLSMSFAALPFLFVSGYGRWWLGAGTGASSRYVYVTAALSLPALAVAADALARLWRPGAVIAAVILASTIPYGISQFDTNPPWSAAYFNGRRELIAALARSPYITKVPRSTRPGRVLERRDRRLAARRAPCRQAARPPEPEGRARPHIPLALRARRHQRSGPPGQQVLGDPRAR